MTQYVNPSTRHNGSKHIVVPRRAFSEEFGEPPFDGEQYVRQDGSWVPIEFPAPILLPAPKIHLALSGPAAVTSASWTIVGSPSMFSTPQDVLVVATLKGVPLGGSGSTLRARLAWSGDTIGNSYALFGNNWSGCISGMTNTARDDASVTFPLVVLAGDTTFSVQALREAGATACSMADTSFTLTPVGWADHYET